MYYQYYVKVHKYRHHACFQATHGGSAAPYRFNLFADAVFFQRFFFSVPTRTSVVLSRSAFCSAKRAIKSVQGCTGLITASKNRMTLQSSTDGNIQKCTSVYIFELRVFHWKNSSLLNTPDILSAITSLTFRQTRVQALYMDVQRLIEDFRFNRCPEYFLPYSCLLLTYSRNSFCEKENAVLYLLIGV